LDLFPDFLFILFIDKIVVLTDIIPAESSFTAGERMCELVKV